MGLSLTDASQTFRQHEILLIGANGFLGKVVLGLLLDRFPDLKHLHILIRPKSNASAQERFYQDVLTSPALAAIAEKLGRECLKAKISVLPGDIGQPGCGMDEACLQNLTGRVALIINCAGLVEFFPPVDESFRSNVDGVEHLVALTRNLRAKLVHVSTCYVCGEADGLIEETEPILGFYPRRKGPDDLSFRHHEELRYCRERIRQIYESAGAPGEHARPKSVLQRLTDLGKQRADHWGWVNTYTYAKSLGEQIIAAEDNLDYAIVRPAIVESALEFPFPGWVEGGRTAAPLVLMAMGGLKHWTVRRDAPLEVVPVDLVASSILAVSALLLNGRSMPVYQLGTADVNPILLEPLVTLLHSHSRKARRKKRSKFVEPPANLGSGVRFVSPQKARARRVRLQKTINRAETVIAGLRRMLDTTGLPGKRSLADWNMALRALGLQASFREQTLELYQPFILDNRYIFESENMRAAYLLLSEKDRQLLPWVPERINWEDYWVNNQINGIERWVQPDAVKNWAFKV